MSAEDRPEHRAQWSMPDGGEHRRWHLYGWTAMKETLDPVELGLLQIGDRVNVELDADEWSPGRPYRAGTRRPDGHLCGDGGCRRLYVPHFEYPFTMTSRWPAAATSL